MWVCKHSTESMLHMLASPSSSFREEWLDSRLTRQNLTISLTLSLTLKISRESNHSSLQSSSRRSRLSNPTRTLLAPSSFAWISKSTKTNRLSAHRLTNSSWFLILSADEWWNNKLQKKTKIEKKIWHVYLHRRFMWTQKKLKIIVAPRTITVLL